MSLLNYFQRSNHASEPASKKARITFSSSSDNSDEESEVEPPSTSSASPSQSSSTTTTTPTHRSVSKQLRSFNTDWLATRNHWLVCKPEGMYCLLCQKYNKRLFNCDTWNTVPCTRLRLQSIKRHESSLAHKDSLKIEAASSTVATLVSVVNPVTPAKGMEQAFTCLYFLTKRQIAHTTNYEALLDLVGYLGTDIKKQIRKAKNATYTSNKTIQEMVFILSEVLEENTLKAMRKCDHFALLIDETTDCTVTEQLAIHGNYIDDTGELRSCYLKIIDLLQPDHDGQSESGMATCISANAQTITNRVCEFISEAKVDISKMRGIGTDGAATMIGCNNGVVARLKRLAPSAISVH